jgi:hypothetical protein
VLAAFAPAQQDKQRKSVKPAAIEAARQLTPRFSPDKFAAWLKKQNASPKVIAAFRSEWKAGPDGRITDRALRAVAAPYRVAMELCDEAKPRGALELAKVLAGKPDPILRAHARYFLARTVLDEDDPEGAVDLLKDFIRHDRGHTYLDGEAAFYLGFSLSLVPIVDEAILNLDIFLKLYADAPERYRANASQLLQDLRAQWQSPLHGIADDMKQCERRLRKDHKGDQVETKQLSIVEKIAVLIEEMEKQQQSGGSPSGNTVPNGPANKSSLPGGEGRVGNLHGSRGVKDRWGNMKDADREKILSELQTKLPERFRVLLEKYYERVNK